MNIIVQIMNKYKINEKNFEVLRKIANFSGASQRYLAKSLGFSLGKLNYCLTELNKKGLIKFNNFYNRKNKFNYAKYVLTPKGIKFRTELTIKFMKKKMQEYEELKNEIKKINAQDN